MNSQNLNSGSAIITRFHLLLAVLSTISLTSTLNASAFTRLSPIAGGSVLPASITEVGGIVFHAKGLNGAILTTQLPASSLFQGFSLLNPFTVGTQTGFTPALLGQLGGGFSEAALRITLYDGDTGAGDFDFNQNHLLLNGFGDMALTNFSNVATQQTTGLGVDIGTSSQGFRDDLLDTGFFHVTDGGFLSGLFTSLSNTQTLVISLSDLNPNDNFYDFKQGIDGRLIDIGTPPVVTQSAPEPTSALTFLGLIVGASWWRTSRRPGKAC